MSNEFSRSEVLELLKHAVDIAREQSFEPGIIARMVLDRYDAETLNADGGENADWEGIGHDGIMDTIYPVPGEDDCA